MGSFSTCRALAHWQGLLLAVSLLNFWCLPTTADFGIYTVDSAVGHSILLTIDSDIPNPGTLIWYKGPILNQDSMIAFLTERSKSQIRGPAFGRVTINSDGSLLVKNLTMEDSDTYSIVANIPGSKKERGFRRLIVHERMLTANLIASNTIFIHNKDAVVFTCDTTGESIRWIFNGWTLQLREGMQLSEDNKILTIDPVKFEHAGYYQCEGSNSRSSVESSSIKLFVKNS